MSETTPRGPTSPQWRERGIEYWREALEADANGDPLHIHSLRAAVVLYGVRPLSAEARYVSDRLGGEKTGKQGNPGYRRTTRDREEVRAFYREALAKLQAEGARKPSEEAFSLTAKEFEIERSTARKYVYSKE